MNTTKTTITMIAALMLGISGCASDPDINNTTASTSESASSSATFSVDSIKTDEKLTAELPEKYAKAKVLNVATSADYPPAEYMDKDGQTPIGFEIDIIKSIAKKMGVEAKVSHAPFESIIPAVGSKYDLSIASFDINEKRTEAVNMVSYMKSGSIFLVPQGNPGKVNADELCGVKLGVQSGTAQQDFAEKAAKQCTDNGKPNIAILPESDAQVLMTKLAGKQLDSAFVDTVVATLAVKNNPGKFETLDKLLDGVPMGIVIGKKDTDLAKVVSKATQELINDGTIEKIFDTWNVDKSSLIKTSELNNPNL